MSLSKNDTQKNPKKTNLHQKINKNLFLTKSIMNKVMVDSFMKAVGSLTSTVLGGMNQKMCLRCLMP